MKIALDEHVPPAVVSALVPLVDDCDICSARHYAPKVKPSSDLPWIEAFVADGGTVIISGEKRMRSVPEYIKGIADTGVIAFYLPAPWNTWDMRKRSAFIITWWDRIVGKAKNSKPGQAWIIPATWTGGDFTEVNLPELGSDP